MTSLESLASLAQPVGRALASTATRLAAGERHPLAPAAIRVERTRARRGGESAEQTAITVWFGEGPQLPAPGLTRPPSWRAAAGLGVTLASAAALAVASTVVAQIEERRRLATARPVRTLTAPARPRRREVGRASLAS
jgi:hypothetical protein